MQQPSKKRSPREMAGRAYDYFRRAEKSARTITEAGICNYTGYALGTLRGYISKIYKKWFLHGDRKRGYTVNGLGQITRSQFIEMHSQVKRFPPKIIIVEKEVERHYTLIAGSTEMWLVVAVLLLAGWWWK